MIGHAMPAAGVAGLIKTALALHHKVLPPTINVDEPNPKLSLDKSPFYINSETRPWIHGSTDGPRRAGVNAFGFGGINAHAILEEVASSSTVNQVSVESSPMPWDSEVFLLASDSRAELIHNVRWLEKKLAADLDPTNLAYTLNDMNEGGSERLALVASSIEELREKLRAASARLSDENCKKIRDAQGTYFASEPLAQGGKLAFLFPGEGSQYTNMLSQLCTRFPEVTKQFDMVDRIFANHSRNLVSHSGMVETPRL